MPGERGELKSVGERSCLTVAAWAGDLFVCPLPGREDRRLLFNHSLCLKVIFLILRTS